MGASRKSEARAFAARFARALTRLVGSEPPRRWLVAFSGGLDSTLLLHALVRAESAVPIVAIHIDHGLHADSAEWSAHCARVAAALGVEFIARELRLEPDAGRSLEARARDARYAALTAQVGHGDVVLTAHHADDQLETVLFRLVRGTGVRGLTAIHARQALGAGRLVRPLLEFTRAEVRSEAVVLGLDWLEDPSNADTRFDRNLLRAECLPPLLARWPQAGVVANRLARLMGEAESVLADVAADDLASAEDAARIPVERLTALSEARRNNALRHAVRRLGLPVPNATQLAGLGRALAARDDAETAVRWPGAEARIYRRRLYLLAPPERTVQDPARLSADRALAFAGGELRLVATDDYGIPDRWARDGLDVAFRTGGERFRPYRSPHHKPLKQWFQERGIVPWMRGRIPLLFHDDRLVAVGDLGLADALPQSADDAPFWRPVWTGHPRLR
jgi:tRNA(Ile)-lysidine synthase